MSKKTNRLLLASTALIGSLMLAGAAFAQETSGAINGTVRGPGGAPVANAPVTIVFEPTKQTFTAKTDSNGLFSLRNVPPGGPYHVTVAGPQGTITQDIASVGVGAAYELDIGGADANAVAEVVVTATRAEAARQVQTGPRSVFNATDVATLPSFQRDFKDVARLNPFVQLDAGNYNGLIIAGNNYRSNAIYVDGVRQTDDFGLNSNGYPTLRGPLSTELVQSLNVEVAPYDVSYGTFTGGVLNIATKSGSNEFHGSAYYDYDSNGLGSGSKIHGNKNVVKFQDKLYGFTFSGPIWRDKLFFQFGYEHYEGLGGASYGASDSANVVNRVSGVTEAQVAQITSILQSRYGVAAGTIGLTSPVADEKYFGKLTFQLNDKHRLVFEAQSTEGSTFSSGSSSTALALSSNTYTLTQPLLSYSGYIYSNWTPNLSTEVSYTDRTVGRIPVTGVNGTPEYDIYLSGNTNPPTIYAGTNYSYQANYLETESKLFRGRLNYTLGQHNFLIGYEHEDRFASDLFIQNANGTFSFTSIADLAAGKGYRLQYSNAASNNTADGVVPLEYIIHTAYIQDEYRPLSNLTIRVGVRDEYYEQGQSPKANTFLKTAFGLDNTTSLDGLNVVLPRVGFNWRPTPDLTISGGVGRFSGGSPDVYINNVFNGSGNILGSVNCFATTSPTCAAALTNVNGTIPDSIKALNTTSANAGTGFTTTLSPSFQPPTVWKTSLTLNYTANLADWRWTGLVGRFLGNDWRVHADYLYQKTDHGLLLQDLDTLGAVSGAAPDGRPIYSTTRTNGTRYDFLLTNTDKGFSSSWAIGFGKTFRSGFDFDATYIHTHAEDVMPFTSSVSQSNFRSNASSDINNPSSAVTNYSIPEVYKVSVGYRHKWFGDYATNIRMFAQQRSGHPFSYVYQLAFAGNGFDTTGFGQTNTLLSTTYPEELLYVPKADASGNVTATSDPKVTYAFGAGSAAGGVQSVEAFNAFLKSTGLIKYNGQIAPRNAFNARDVTTIDLQFTQEIPAFFPQHAKAELYAAIFNLGNLLNSNWGVTEEYGFPYLYQAVQAQIVPCTPTSGCAAGQTTQYKYTGYNQSSTSNLRALTAPNGGPPPSTWALKVGIRYRF